MSKTYTFRAPIEDSGGGGAFVSVPFDVERVFGRKRVPVKATINGVPYRGTLMRMGKPCHILGVLKEIRQKTGREVGDEVEVILEEDTEQRVVELPQDFRQTLEKDPAAGAAFEKLSYTHQKEHVTAILGAKKAETRSRRIAKSIEMLKEDQH